MISTASPDDRLREIAALLAAGVVRLRLRKSSELPAPVPESSFPNPSESAAQGVAVLGPAVLTVPHVVNGNRDTETRSTR